MEADEAWALFTTPRPAPRSAAGERVLESARCTTLEHRGGRLDGGRKLCAYAWGDDSGETVYLAHGWGGSSGQMALFVEPLVARGLHVVAIDTPAHGRSEGARTEIYEFVAALEEWIERHGPPRGVIGHSLGGAAATIAAARGFDIGRAALLAATARLSDEVEKFARRVELSADEHGALRTLMEHRVPGIWRDTELVNLAPAISSPVLVVHDEHDPEVPYADSERLAVSLPNGAFHGTSGLGHVALLRNADVVARVVEFIAPGVER